MLSRTANNLYWLARYAERMNYVARLLEVGMRMASVSPGANEWESAIVAAGCEQAFKKKYATADAASVIDFLTRDPDNGSSIFNCVERARQNARSVRIAVTIDMWEAINDTWLQAKEFVDSDFEETNVAGFLDWAISRSTLFNGAYSETMLRNDAYHFTRLGTNIERADNTARILDVKYHVLLPRSDSVGGVLDYHQWSSILSAVSARRGYHHLYKERVQPKLVAEFLLLRAEQPRSLRCCFDEITQNLDALAQAYGGRAGECHRLAGEMHARLKYGRIEEVFRQGLHEFLTDFINHTIRLGDEIDRFYLM